MSRYQEEIDNIRIRVANLRMGKAQKDWPRIIRVTPSELRALCYYYKLIEGKHPDMSKPIKFMDCQVAGPNTEVI